MNKRNPVTTTGEGTSIIIYILIADIEKVTVAHLLNLVVILMV